MAEPLTEFPLFSELASELRLKVWNYALREPRVVCLGFKGITNPSKGIANPFISSVPALLHTCTESREEALRYKRVFELGSNTDNSYGIYLDFDIDVFYVAHSDDDRLISFDGLTSFDGGAYNPYIQELRKKIKHLAVNHELWYMQWMRNRLTAIKNFTALETIILVKNDFSSLDDKDLILGEFREYPIRVSDLCRRNYHPPPGYEDRWLIDLTAQMVMNDINLMFEDEEKRDLEWKRPVLKFMEMHSGSQGNFRPQQEISILSATSSMGNLV